MPQSYNKLLCPPPPLEREDLVFALIGASAVGKSATAQALCEAGITQATPTWTTRSPRPGESDTCYDHHFVRDDQFNRQIKSDGFLDYRSLYGARYGIPQILQPAEGQEALIVLKPLFIPMFTVYFPLARIYQIDASAAVLPERMRGRGQTEGDIAARMQKHKEETLEAREYAHVVFHNNGSLEETVAQVIVQMRIDRASFEDPVEKAALPVTL